MTAQFLETLHYEGQELGMAAQPLADYFAFGGQQPRFLVRMTALWRGYVGTWEIRDSRLYLIGISAELKDGSTVTLETLFPGYPKRVFAHWFSGEIRVPQGRMLEYVHAGFSSKYQADLLLQIEKGVLVSSELRHNGPAGEPVEVEQEPATPQAFLHFGRGSPDLPEPAGEGPGAEKVVQE